MGNAMSALSREEREGLRDGTLSGPGDRLVTVSHDDVYQMLIAHRSAVMQGACASERSKQAFERLTRHIVI